MASDRGHRLVEAIRRSRVRTVADDEHADAGREPVEVVLELVLLGGGLDGRQREGRLLVGRAEGAPHDEQNRASSGF